MLRTPSTTSWEISLEIFSYVYRPCRPMQETIWDYHLDGRPLFEWERLRNRWALEGNPKIWQYCEACPLNVFGEIEGCKGQVENLDIFFRALSELTPDSPWANLPHDGTPVHQQQAAELSIHLPALRQELAAKTWPVAVPRLNGQPYYENPEEEAGRFQLYAWNGEGPPGVLSFNDGYAVYLSRHGLLVKPTAEDPIPHAFTRLWREGRGVFGLSTAGETVGFQMAYARYPTWGFEAQPGADLTAEAMPADQVFEDVLNVLEVFCGTAGEYETGLVLQSSG